MALKEGGAAPTFALKDKAGRAVDLKAIDSEFTVVYFYPKDDTPGCTLEAKGFTKYLDQFKRHKATVIGISGGDERSKQKFCDKHGIQITLLSDPDFKVAKKFGSYGLKKFMGRTYSGILRNTYLLDRKKRIVKIFEGVKPETHPQEVLQLIKSGGKEPAQLSLQFKADRKPPKKSMRGLSPRKAAAGNSAKTAKKSAAKKPAAAGLKGSRRK